MRRPTIILAVLAVSAVAASCGGAQELRSLVDTVIPEPTASPAPTLEPTSEPPPTATATTVPPAPPTLTPVPPTPEPASIVYYADADGDGYGDPASSLQASVAPPGYVTDDTDCDDSDDSVNPGAAEVFDGIDNNCDGVTDEGVIPTATATPTLTPTPTVEVELTFYFEDFDLDGWGGDNFVEAVVEPPGYIGITGDCDDFDPEVYPGAIEVADGKDNDCDGEIDEGITMLFYEDLDADTYGGPNSAPAIVTPAGLLIPPGYVAMSGDCDDANPAVNPGAAEVFDGMDNDCDGEIDEGVIPTGEWTTKAPVSLASNGPSVGAIDGLIYVVAGWNGSHRNDLYAYNPATDTWATKAPSPLIGNGRAHGVINGVLYEAGGTNCCVTVNSVFAYDPATNT